MEYLGWKEMLYLQNKLQAVKKKRSPDLHWAVPEHPTGKCAQICVCLWFTATKRLSSTLCRDKWEQKHLLTQGIPLQPRLIPHSFNSTRGSSLWHARGSSRSGAALFHESFHSLKPHLGMQRVPKTPSLLPLLPPWGGTGQQHPLWSRGCSSW